MHILIILLVAAIALYIILMAQRSNQTNEDSPHTALSQDNAPSQLSEYRIAFISRGKLYIKDGHSGSEELQSPYVQGVMDRLEKSRRLHGWKEGTAFETSYTSQQSNLPPDKLDLKTTAAQFTPDGKLIYFIGDKQVGGLFEFDFMTKSEKRLLHRQRLSLKDLNLSPNGQQLLCSQHNANETVNICLMNADGSDFQELTGGDTVDSNPAWISGDDENIVFQSSGLARNEHGFVVALGPASLQMLHLEKRELSAVKEDDDFDYLQPKVDPAGDLYFIRRPYELPRYHSSSFLADLVLFPFRLFRAVFHYLNFFSLMYSRKPLTSASGPEVQADLKELLIKGKRINAENALRKENRINGVSSLVPSSWQLIKRTRMGKEQVLASNVAAYDITADGTIIFTNGYGVFAIDESNGTQVLLRNKLIAELMTQ